MPKNKFQDVIFTIIMATIMVYGMVVYNVALNTGTVNGTTFLAATHELPIMVPIAFVLEFFVVGKIAKMLAFTVMRPTDRPQFITYAISICICCIMCPVMSLVATFLFKEPSFGMWVKTWAMNFPMAICYQMFYCGPLVRLIFRAIFVRKNADATEGRIILITKGLSLDSPLKKSIIYNITFSNKNTITGMVTIALSVVITFMALAYFESLPYT